MRKHWAIIGGGMMGLTLALRLAKLGQKITLFEAGPSIGGLASVWNLGKVEWEKYYHVILLSDFRLRELLNEIELDQDLSWTETKTGFFTQGSLYSMSNTREFLAFPPLSLIEKVRLGATIFYASKIRNWKRLERIGVEDWLRRWSGNGVFDKIWQPLLKAKLGDTYTNASAAFIWASINRMYKARRTGLKKEMFGFVKGGYRSVLTKMEKLLLELGVDIKTEHPITRVSKQNSEFEVEFSGRESKKFDRVVMSTPCSVVSKVCEDLSESEKNSFGNIDYLGIICASLLTKKPLSPYYVTNITDSWVPLTAVIEMSNVVDKCEFDGSSLVYLPKYLPSNDRMFDLSDEEIQVEFLDVLEKMYPDFDRRDIQAFRVSRTRSVMPLPIKQFSKQLPSMKTTVDGLYVVNSAYILKGNLNINETVSIAEEAITNSLANEFDVESNRQA